MPNPDEALRPNKHLSTTITLTSPCQQSQNPYNTNTASAHPQNKSHKHICAPSYRYRENYKLQFFCSRDRTVPAQGRQRSCQPEVANRLTVAADNCSSKSSLQTIFTQGTLGHDMTMWASTLPQNIHHLPQPFIQPTYSSQHTVPV